ncbi:hypothetical protein EQV77_09705 [Halobacillus fulvus]|nr:hypothetical protein EQV77_09705 [Halobacillus fulvus]
MSDLNVYGVKVDQQTRCQHYHSDIDVIAIKFRCCGKFYACHACHEEMEDHAADRWPEEEWDETAIMCGNCRNVLTIREYMDVNSCPSCEHSFNERCSNHYPLYFSIGK